VPVPIHNSPPARLPSGLNFTSMILKAQLVSSVQIHMLPQTLAKCTKLHNLHKSGWDCRLPSHPPGVREKMNLLWESLVSLTVSRMNTIGR
jgi:hypothetical protein